MALDLAPFRLGSEVRGPFAPLAVKRTDLLATVHCYSEKKAAHDFQDFVSFLPLQDLGRSRAIQPT